MPNLATQALPDVIRILLVEPDAFARATLREIFMWEPDFDIVREVADTDAAIALVRHDPVDVILVDTQPAVANFIADLQRLKRECPASPVVVLSHRQDDGELFGAIMAGAAAHVLDIVRPTELVRIIRSVAAGEYVIDATVAARPAVARLVLEAFREFEPHRETLEPVRVKRTVELLSDRELEVLTAISRGLPNKEIAAALSIRPNTVHNLVQSSLRKLSVNNRTHAVLIALSHGWIRLPD